MGLAFRIGSLIGPLDRLVGDHSLARSLAGAGVVAPYIIYLALFGAFLLVRRWVTFGLACTVLACLLLLNVSGCREVLAGLSQIQ